MPYYYNVSSQQAAGASGTETVLAGFWTAAAGARSYIQKVQCGSFVAPADNAIRIRLQHATAGTVTAGSGFTPAPHAPDAPAAATGAQTLPTIATPTYGNPL